MNPLPAPQVPGSTDYERFDNAVRMVFSVPKDVIVKAEAKLKKQREKKRAKKG